MGARTDCRHYNSRTLPGGDSIETCRLNAAEPVPFSCPDGCVFFEARPISDAGWQQAPPDRR